MKNKKLYRIYMRNISQIDRKNKHKKKIKKVNINPAGRHTLIALKMMIKPSII